MLVRKDYLSDSTGTWKTSWWLKATLDFKVGKAQSLAEISPQELSETNQFKLAFNREKIPIQVAAAIKLSGGLPSKTEIPDDELSL